MKKIILMSLAALFCLHLSAQQSVQDQKMKWWREARFGMFPLS